MGNTNNCQNLKLEPNSICNIGKCAEYIKGQPSNSASESDIWIVKLKKDTKYGKQKINYDVVLKIFLNVDELIYESRVYEEVIKKITDNNVCPFFVNFYGNAKNCSFSQMLDNMKGKVMKDNGNFMSDEECEEVLLRNTFVYGEIPKESSGSSLESGSSLDSGSNSYSGSSLDSELILTEPKITRQSISDPNTSTLKKYLKSTKGAKKLYTKFVKNKDNIKYNIIATQRSSGLTFNTWFKKNKTDLKPNHKAEVAIIHVISALVVLETFECAHNDFHLGNIFMQTFNAEYKDKFIFDDQNKNYNIFETTTNIIPKLYDWDRSYVKSLGDNPYITNYPNMCDSYMNCNEYVKGRDILKFIVHCSLIIKDEVYKKKLFKCCFISGFSIEISKFYTDVLKGPLPTSLQDRRGRTLTKYWFDRNVLSPRNILLNLIQLFKNESKNPLITHNMFLAAPGESVINGCYDFTSYRLKLIEEDKTYKILSEKERMTDNEINDVEKIQREKQEQIIILVKEKRKKDREEYIKLRQEKQEKQLEEDKKMQIENKNKIEEEYKNQKELEIKKENLKRIDNEIKRQEKELENQVTQETILKIKIIEKEQEIQKLRNKSNEVNSEFRKKLENIEEKKQKDIEKRQKQIDWYESKINKN